MAPWRTARGNICHSWGRCVYMTNNREEPGRSFSVLGKISISLRKVQILQAHTHGPLANRNSRSTWVVRSVPNTLGANHLPAGAHSRPPLCKELPIGQRAWASVDNHCLDGHNHLVQPKKSGSNISNGLTVAIFTREGVNIFKYHTFDFL